MTEHVFAPPPWPSVAVRGGAQRYAVRRIFCVARNYAAHAREMGHDPDREPPFYFLKSAAHLWQAGGGWAYPPGTRNCHHEVELVVALGAPLWRASPEQAAQAVWGGACGLDMTRRDLQAEAREAGRPWDLAKDFEQAAIMGELVPLAGGAAPSRGRIALTVNGALRQQGDLQDMIWPVPELLAHLSAHYHLGPGDLVYTGTPEGVGPVLPGDRLHGEIDGVGSLDLAVGPAV